MKMHGKLCVEFAELGIMRKTDKLEEIKSWVTETVDEYRMPYGREVARYPRRFVIIGTGNKLEFLQDAENRRWWPVEVGTIDRKYLLAHRDQLFAEAVVEYRNGYEFWEMPKQAAIDAQEAHRLVNPWHDVIEKCIAEGRSLTGPNLPTETKGISKQELRAFPNGFGSSLELLMQWLKVPEDRLGTRHAQDLADVMRALKFQKVRERKARGVNGWVPEGYVYVEAAKGPGEWKAPKSGG